MFSLWEERDWDFAGGEGCIIDVWGEAWYGREESLGGRLIRY